MKHRRRIIFISIPILLLLLLFGGFKYRTEYARKEIAVYESADRACQLVICSIGEPQWPFGPGKCRLILSKSGKTISQCDFLLYNDGKWPREDNFSVEWGADGVRVTARGEEQEDAVYTLYY